MSLAGGFLSFFSEIRQTQRHGGLILALVAHTGADEDDYRDEVGQHFVQLLNGEIAAGGDEDIEDVQPAEEDGGQHAETRPPDREDNEGNGEPAPVAEGVVRPDAAGVIHHVVQPAEAGDHAADAGGFVLIFVDIDTGGVGRVRAFADGAQVQAHARVIEHV